MLVDAQSSGCYSLLIGSTIPYSLGLREMTDTALILQKNIQVDGADTPKDYRIEGWDARFARVVFIITRKNLLRDLSGIVNGAFRKPAGL